jgi:hypothetical protein
MSIDIDLEEVLESALEEEGLEIREGTPTHDIFVKAGQNLFNKFVGELNSLSDEMTLTDVEGNSPDEVDAVMQNYFVDRLEGAPSKGTIRLFISDTRDISLSEGQRFFSKNGRAFVSDEEVVISAEELTANQQNELYYFDVDVRSQFPGVNAETDIQFMENEITGLVKIETIERPRGGIEGEDNQELVDRAKKQIGIRDLVREGSIFAQLQSEFPFIERITPIGFQEPEMHRDVLGWLDREFKEYIEANCPGIDTVPPGFESYHVGMHFDVYLQAKEIQEEHVTLDLTNRQVFDGSQSLDIESYEENPTGKDTPLPDGEDPKNADYHIVDVDNILREVPISFTKACVITNLSQANNQIQNAQAGNCTLELTTSPQGGAKPEVVLTSFNDDDLMYSTRAKYAIKIRETEKGGPSNINKVVTFKYLYVPEIATVQRYFDDEENRIITSDALAKHFIPTFIDVDVQFSGDISETQAENAIITLIENDELQEESDIVGALYDNGAEYVNLDSLNVFLEVHSIDGSVVLEESHSISGDLKLDSIANDVPKLTRRIQTFLPRDINAESL